MKFSAMTLFLFITLSILSACSGAPDKDPLSIKWAKYISANPGGESPESEDARKAMIQSAAFEKAGFKFYKKKQDKAAITNYAAAIGYYATGRLYFRYANSLSNIPLLEDAARAYGIARSLGFKKDGVLAYNAACAYSRLGKYEKTFELLKEAVRDGYSAFRYMQRDSDLKSFWKNADKRNRLKDLKKIYKTKFLDVKLNAALKKAIRKGDLKQLQKIVIQAGNNRLPVSERVVLFGEALKLGKKNILLFMINNIIGPNDEGVLLEDGNYDRAGNVLALTLQSRFPDLAIVLLKKGADPKKKFVMMNSQSSALHVAVSSNNIPFVKACLDRGVPVDYVADRFGSTPLLTAVSSKHVSMVKFLLSRGANIDASYFRGETAILIAILEKQKKLIKILEQHEEKVTGRKAMPVFQRLFKRLYLKKKLVNKRKNLGFIFVSSPNFDEHGIGHYQLHALDEKKFRRQKKHFFGFHENGRFRIIGNTIQLLNYFAYVGFPRSFRIKPAGRRGLYINGAYYKESGPAGKIYTLE